MDFQIKLADLLPGDAFSGYYLLSEIQVRKSSNGKPYLSATLGDCSASIPAKMWDYGGGMDARDNGSVVYLEGDCSEFRGTPQVTIRKMRPVNERDRYDISDLVPSAPIDTDRALDDIRRLAASIKDDDYRAVAEKMLERHLEKFKTIPAAKSVHHAFRGGLLMHTAYMLQTADFLAGLYCEVIDRSLLLAGTMLHDFAKEEEFVFSDLGLVTDYSIAGDLLGHLYMGAREVSEVAGELHVPEEKSMLLQHLLLSHHGQPEHGACVLPKCAEAELLSLIDQVDSRMEIYAETFETTDVGTFSPRIFALEKRIFNHGLPEDN